ncbi:MAG: hypothetical protein ABH950_05350 [Candidatus Altiarchaeota archaeon]
MPKVISQGPVRKDGAAIALEFDTQFSVPKQLSQVGTRMKEMFIAGVEGAKDFFKSAGTKFGIKGGHWGKATGVLVAKGITWEKEYPVRSLRKGIGTGEPAPLTDKQLAKIPDEQVTGKTFTQLEGEMGLDNTFRLLTQRDPSNKYYYALIYQRKCLTQMKPRTQMQREATLNAYQEAKRDSLASPGTLEDRQAGKTPISLLSVEAGGLKKRANQGAVFPDLQKQTDSFVFLAGGAAKMSEEARAKLTSMMSALPMVSEGRKLGVGYGGTDEGIMKAAGDQRRGMLDKGQEGFKLLGIAPDWSTSFYESDVDNWKNEMIGPKFVLDKDASHMITVRDFNWLERQLAQGWDKAWTHFGSETDEMYAVFNSVSKDKPSVTLVANGGSITLDEVQQNIQDKRRMIILEGSGRAADVISGIVKGTDPLRQTTEAAQIELAKLGGKAEKIGVAENRDLFRIVNMNDGPQALAKAINEELGVKG